MDRVNIPIAADGEWAITDFVRLLTSMCCINSFVLRLEETSATLNVVFWGVLLIDVYLFDVSVFFSGGHNLGNVDEMVVTHVSMDDPTVGI